MQDWNDINPDSNTSVTIVNLYLKILKKISKNYHSVLYTPWRILAECIDRHAPLKRIKCTRPPAPWLKSLDIQQLISERNRKRYLAHLTQKTSDWTAYRAVRNKLKHAIRTTKKKFLTSALSDKRPRNIWRFIHRILKPKNQTITVNVDDLNKHFITTANRLLKSEHLEPQDILKTLESLPDQTSKANFNLQYVTYEQVEKELKDLRLDCSAGYDNISVQHVKSVYENLVSPLTHIINSSISENLFPIQWKKAKISPIPKSDDPQNFDDYRPVSVLPLFSKVYERLVAKQLCTFLERSCTLKDTMAGFRKSHSTNTLLLKIRDDILRAMSKGELTLSVYSDYSKAFDTAQHHTIIQKLHKIGFSTSAPK